MPLFFYVAHLYLIHALAILLARATTGSAVLSAAHKPAGYGLGLGGTYAVWRAVVISLFPFCRWFAAIKQRRTGWWWSYL